MTDRATAPTDEARDAGLAAALAADAPLRRTVSGLAPVRPRPWYRSAQSVLEIVQGRHVRIWLLVVVATIVIGTAGYVVLFGWDLVDSAYMTVITMTTVGFREVRELVAWPERLWTMLLAISGVGIIYGSIGIVAEAILAEASSGRREARRMAEAVAELRGHFIMCGYGRVGSTVARELVHAGQRIVVIDILPASLEDAQRDGHLVVQGDATSDETLRLAGVERARGLVATIDSDANNVYVTLSARSMNPGLFIVGRANAEGSDAKLLQAGANRVVSPYTMAGRRMAELAIRPRVADFIDAALSHGELRFSMEEVEVASGGPLDGRSVADLREDGIFTLAIVHGEGNYEPNPPPDRVLAVGESLVVSGSTERLTALRERA
jgi:voltage-gated potassium channel